MRILELCTSPDSGGLELYMTRACVALAAAGDQVRAVVAPVSRIAERLCQHNIKMDTLAFRFAPLPLVAARRLAKLIDQHEIEAIHLHWGRDLPLAALAKYFSVRSPRLVYTRHMQITRSKKDLYHRWLYRQVDLLLTITETMTTKVRESLDEQMSTRVATLYHGAPAVAVAITDQQRQQLRRGWGVAEDAVLVGLFSRLEEPKGQHLLIEALRRARDEGVALHGLIVGHVMDPEYVSALQAKIETLGLANKVHFEGFSNDIQQWMQACDIVALTTREETFGLVLIEAMRAAVAVVGSDRGGVPEIIRHQQNGLLFRSGDAEDLYGQLRRLALDRTLRDGLAVAGQQDADLRFNDEIHFCALRDYLHGAIGGIQGERGVTDSRKRSADE